ncbi:hypothetical protein J6T66_04170 [bacterium]|nr:hypothetical protein [bacterium]
MIDLKKIKNLMTEKRILPNLMKMTLKSRKNYQNKKEKLMNYVSKSGKFLKFQILNIKIA